jgi:hypothetical protein
MRDRKGDVNRNNALRLGRKQFRVDVGHNTSLAYDDVSQEFIQPIDVIEFNLGHRVT